MYCIIYIPFWSFPCLMVKFQLNISTDYFFLCSAHCWCLSDFYKRAIWTGTSAEEVSFPRGKKKFLWKRIDFSFCSLFSPVSYQKSFLKWAPRERNSSDAKNCISSVAGRAPRLKQPPSLFACPGPVSSLPALACGGWSVWVQVLMCRCGYRWPTEEETV